MTYCLAIAVERGLVFCADSRTNAGVDQISTYSKMHTFGIAGERQFVLLSAGNLATTQAVVGELRQDIRAAVDNVNLFKVKSLNEAADYIGEISLRRQGRYAEHRHLDFDPTATFILGGQIQGEAAGVLQIYAEGNYITTSRDHPFLQIGESKYGKPILDRVIAPTTSLGETAKCALASMDSTRRSNLSVGPPIELRVYERDTLLPGRYLRFDEDDPYLRQLGRNWNQKLIAAFRELPDIEWNP